MSRKAMAQSASLAPSVPFGNVRQWRMFALSGSESEAGLAPV